VMRTELSFTHAMMSVCSWEDDGGRRRRPGPRAGRTSDLNMRRDSRTSALLYRHAQSEAWFCQHT
jgi:hypothetical protein